MLNYTEQEEKNYLKNLIMQIATQLEGINERIKGHSSDILEEKKYLWENIYELDPMEITSARMEIEKSISTGNETLKLKKKLEKMKDSPFFGRIDFRYEDSDEENIYIGMYSFSEEGLRKMLVFDWRSPIASMFYDFEKGKAYYFAPSGEISGEITLKRQYKIKNGKMEYMLESSMNINDDILQQVLNKASDSKMRNIVNTIQKEQNTIIRNSEDDVLIIQGVVGSGKTSIALHRIAYLLYRYKETLHSKNILIISPNKVFSDYISNVLPELGEEQILEVCMDEIAKNELPKKIKFESKYNQDERIMENEDTDYSQRVKFKSSYAFVEKLQEFVNEYINKCFKPCSLAIGDYKADANFIKERFNNYSKLSVLARIEEVTDDIFDRCVSNNVRGNNKLKVEIKKFLLSKLKYTDVITLYTEFYNWLGVPEMLILNGNVLEYSDIFPVLYLKMAMEGFKEFNYIKHLVVDEMQDYTHIQYQVLDKMFKCKKTILGDADQILNPYSSTAEDIKKIYQDAKIVELVKSYRSTYEIIGFAQNIVHNEKLIPVERHGDKPQIIKCDLIGEEITKILKDFKKSKFESICIICKTVNEAKTLYVELSKKFKNITLLTADSSSYNKGIIITTAHVSKGLEFDHVIVANCNNVNYSKEVDKGLLYIACTRAMHKLTLLYNGEISHLLKNEE